MILCYNLSEYCICGFFLNRSLKGMIFIAKEASELL